ncbi:hypothetical protein [Chelativorans sp. J32]|uniref:hypothetical protein n=1 Tax=Chelativorans sp. J32 TaxID=935840 RepID=UPI0004B24E5D|nr:hypothetical protein [Chelativorans sp. J32]
MAENDAKKHVKVETDLSETNGTDSSHERMNAEPETEDLTDPQEVWRDAERTPSGADQAKTVTSGSARRVADAGDVGEGRSSPYGTEAQADALARQTSRTGEPREPEKPRRG